MKKQKDWWIRVIFLLFVIAVLCSMCSCNTIHGFGEDIKTISEPYVTAER